MGFLDKLKQLTGKKPELSNSQRNNAEKKALYNKRWEKYSKLHRNYDNRFIRNPNNNRGNEFPDFNKNINYSNNYRNYIPKGGKYKKSAKKTTAISTNSDKRLGKYKCETHTHKTLKTKILATKINII